MTTRGFIAALLGVVWVSLLWVSLLWASQAWAGPAWAQPVSQHNSAAPRAFAFFDQSPVAGIYGLPRAGSYIVLAPGRQRLTLHLSQSSHYLEQSAGAESLLIDGATTRAALVYARGLGDGWQVRLTLPLVSHSGGFADDFIDDWHQFFGLPPGKRADAPDGRQIFRYRRNGQTHLLVADEPSGLGDVRLGLKKRLAGFGDWGLSVAAQLKLPTGDPGKLTGSGAADLALWAVIGNNRGNNRRNNGGNNRQKHSAWRLLAAAGALYTGDGNVLPKLRQNMVGFGWFVLGYALTPNLIARAQVYLHTPFYTDTAIEALNGMAVQGAFGFGWRVSDNSRFSLAVIEDLNPGAAPDVAVMLSLSHGF